MSLSCLDAITHWGCWKILLWIFIEGFWIFSGNNRWLRIISCGFGRSYRRLCFLKVMDISDIQDLNVWLVSCVRTRREHVIRFFFFFNNILRVELIKLENSHSIVYKITMISPFSLTSSKCTRPVECTQKILCILSIVDSSIFIDAVCITVALFYYLFNDSNNESRMLCV